MEKQSFISLLSSNPYPGRGIVLGTSPDGLKSVAAYFIMGRSENSRNRVFVPTPDGIRTQAHDPNKMTNPELIIYHPVREIENYLIVTNGDQTDTIRDAIKNLDLKKQDQDQNQVKIAFQSALDTRTFEPDAPNYTPRISGLLFPDGGFSLSILKSYDGNPDGRCHGVWDYSKPMPGEGRFLHTYQKDGNPLPSFEGEPVRVSLDAPNAEILANTIWDVMDEGNKISLYVRYTDIQSGSYQTVLLNKLSSGFRGRQIY